MAQIPRWFGSTALAVGLVGVVCGSLPPERRPVERSRVPPRFDQAGDPLPDGAIARLGTTRNRQGSQIHQIVYSPDGKSIYTLAPEEPGVTVWDSGTGRVRQRVAAGTVWSLAVSPDGRLVGTGDDQGSLRVWDADTGREIADFGLPIKLPPLPFPGRIHAQFNLVQRVAFLGNDRLLSHHTTDQTLRLWSISNRRLTATIQGAEDDPLVSFAVSADGRTILTGSAKGELGVWNASDASQVRRFTGHHEHIVSLAVNADGSAAVTGGFDATVRGWDLKTGRERWHFPSSALSQALSMAPSGDSFAIVEFNGEAESSMVKLRSMADGKELRGIGVPFRLAVSVAHSPDGAVLTTGGADNSIRHWSTINGREIQPTLGHHGPLTTVAMSRDGKSIATCSAAETAVRIWNAGDGRQIRILEDHPAGVDEVQFSPDGRLVASGCWGHPVFLWDVSTGKRLHSLADHPCVGPHFRFSNDGKSIATAGRAGSVGVWNCATGKLTAEYAAPPNDVASLISFVDGRLLALERQDPEEDSEVGAVVLWDVTSGRAERRFAGHQGMINGAVLSADLRSLASRGEDQTIRIWEVATGSERRSFRDPGESSGWTGTQFLSFAPNGRTLASCGNHDPFPRIWNLRAGIERPPLRGHSGWIGGLEFASDGRRLLTGGQDTSAIVWDVGDRVSQPGVHPLPSDELARCWDALARADAGPAYQSIWLLIDGGDAATAFLRERLRPSDSADRRQIARWIEQLDHPQFVIRERATAALAKVADQAEDDLRSTMPRATPEARDRIRRILDGVHESTQTPERLRVVRVLEVLEGQASPAARELLGELSRGAPQAFLTREAQDSMRRLEQRGRN